MKREENTVYMNLAEDCEGMTSLREAHAKGQLIFNAPRPLPGMKGWLGEFRHGSYFTAIDPIMDRDDEFFRRQKTWMLQECKDLDGWPVIIVTNEMILAACKEHAAEADCTWQEIVEYYEGVGDACRSAWWPYVGKD